MLTTKRLKSLVKYDPVTGIFTWLTTGRKKRPGAEAGCKTGHLYRRIMIDGRSYYAQRLAWFYMTGQWPKILIDHRNGDGFDNRWKNLRQANKQQNSVNSRPRSRSGLKGVYADKSGSWRAAVTINGRQIHLGSHATKESAAAAYQHFAKSRFGEFVRAA